MQVMTINCEFSLPCLMCNAHRSSYIHFSVAEICIIMLTSLFECHKAHLYPVWDIADWHVHFDNSVYYTEIFLFLAIVDSKKGEVLFVSSPTHGYDYL